MKEILKTLYKNLSKRFLSLLALFMLFAGISCTNSIDSPSSDDPTGTGIIVIESIPDFLFGNASEESEIDVNTETFPDGSDVEFGITDSSLLSLLSGCLLDADTFLAPGGRAFARYLAGINIQPGSVLVSADPPEETVNVAVKITRSGTQDTESDFVSIPLQGVGLIAPDDQDLDVPQAGDPGSAGLTLEFAAVGLLDGTIVNFALSNPAKGSLNPTSDQVAGGVVVTEYTATNGQAGTQVVTATAILPNPFDFDQSCPNVPEGDRTIRERMVITQSVSTGGGVAEAACDDAADNDGDGDTDCADSDCEGQTCAVGMTCTAGACLP